MGAKMSGLSRDMIIHPGETLKEVMEDRNMSQQELAYRTGVTPKHISTVLNGEKNITSSFAKKLEYAFNIDAEFWMNLQTDYDNELLEFDELHNISTEDISIFKKLKDEITFIYKNNFVQKFDTLEEQILELRKYLNISELNSIPSLVSSGAFRAQTSVNYDPYVLFAWQRICDSLSEKIEIKEMPQADQIAKLIEICPKIKELSLLPQEKFITKLQEYFSSCGIAFVIAPSFKGAPVQGYIKTAQNGKTTICMTFRQKRADIFWFTLFHEIAHFINGDSKQKFIDFESTENSRELKADLFAQNTLIEKEAYQDFVSKQIFSLNTIKEFSKQQNILPSILIGRMQKEKLLKWTDYPEQIVKYEKL